MNFRAFIHKQFIIIFSWSVIGLQGFASETCRSVFKFSSVDTNIMSPFRSKEALARWSADSVRNIENTKKYIETLSHLIEAEATRRKSGESGHNEKLLSMVNRWSKAQRPSQDELPEGLRKPFRDRSEFNSNAAFFSFLREHDFQIVSEQQLLAVTRIARNLVFTHPDLKELESILIGKAIERLTKPSGGLFAQPGGREWAGGIWIRFLGSLNYAIDKYRYLNGPFKDAMDFVIKPDLKAPINDINDQLLFRAIKIVEAETAKIELLRADVLTAENERKTKELEERLSRVGLNLAKVNVGGVPYAQLHTDVATAFLKIVDQLGPEYGKYAEYPGVTNRPLLFIREIQKLESEGLDRDQAWASYSSRTIDLYRFVGGRQSMVDSIAVNGMQPAFIRNGGTPEGLKKLHLKQGTRHFVTQHMGEAVLDNTPVLSSTLSSASDMAYAIAVAYSHDKGAPIHTYHLKVPITQVVVASGRSTMAKNFEILVWGGVPRANVSHISEESPDRYISSADMRDSMAASDLPALILEPEE